MEGYSSGVMICDRGCQTVCIDSINGLNRLSSSFTRAYAYMGGKGKVVKCGGSDFLSKAVM